ncbi:hypothetical protein [Paramicrobacterium humi]|uniref:hypothetical protein n=1 Tax=Paramicrobacterium humi TaxID=640635 RepID=UPI001C40A3EF|nr:hypothetical protein [Microbacterium humi]
MWVDRWRRRGILIASDVVRAVLLATLPLGALAGGAIGELFGVRAALWLSGTLLVLPALPLYVALRGHRDVEELPTWAVASQPNE